MLTSLTEMSDQTNKSFTNVVVILFITTVDSKNIICFLKLKLKKHIFSNI